MLEVVPNILQRRSDSSESYIDCSIIGHSVAISFYVVGHCSRFCCCKDE